MSRHFHRHATGLLFAAATLAIAASAQAADIASRFDSGSEGWLVSDITSLPGAGVAATWDSTLQRIGTSDIATWTTYSAPAAFLGDKTAFYGGSFSFQLTDNAKDANADTVATFGIASGTTAMYWFGGSPSITEMTSFSATLSPADSRWRIGGLPVDFNSGSAPTALQFQGVLAAITAIRINADWTTSFNDITALDNVVLAAAPVPEPASAWLLALGLPLLVWRASRRRPA